MTESAIEEQLHSALKAAWPYVNRPFTSNSAKAEVRQFAEATSVEGQRGPMLFALQTAWTFVHGSDNHELLAKMRNLLGHSSLYNHDTPTADTPIMTQPITPNALARGLPDADLRELVREVLAWRKTGVLTGNATQQFAARLVEEAGMDDRDALQIADNLVVVEAATRFSAQS